MSPSARDDLETTPPPPNASPSSTKPEPEATDIIDEEETTYPDGGLQAWLVVLGSFCGMYVAPSHLHVKLTVRKLTTTKG
jgi:hypothetical protein